MKVSSRLSNSLLFSLINSLLIHCYIYHQRISSEFGGHLTLAAASLSPDAKGVSICCVVPVSGKAFSQCGKTRQRSVILRLLMAAKEPQIASLRSSPPPLTVLISNDRPPPLPIVPWTECFPMLPCIVRGKSDSRRPFTLLKSSSVFRFEGSSSLTLPFTVLNSRSPDQSALPIFA